MLSGVITTYVNCTTADNGFYTIQSARDDDEEFVSTNSNAKANTNTNSIVQPKAVDSSGRRLQRSLPLPNRLDQCFVQIRAYLAHFSLINLHQQEAELLRSLSLLHSGRHRTAPSN
jgi:hypothetical protein